MSSLPAVLPIIVKNCFFQAFIPPAFCIASPGTLLSIIGLMVEKVSSLWSTIVPLFWVLFFFGGSIFFHELGHFLAAKARGLFIPRFSIGFGPKIFSKKWGDTEFCLSLFPLGGYVALPQLMDAKAIEGQYKVPQNLPALTTFDRVLVASMGAVFNLLFAFVLAVILWHCGIEKDFSLTNNTVGYIHQEFQHPDGTKVRGPAAVAGIQLGDKIVAIDGYKIKNFSDIQHAIALGKKRDESGPIATVTIEHNGQLIPLIVHPELSPLCKRTGENLRLIGLSTSQHLMVANLYNGGPAAQVGLQKGDHLIEVNGVKIYSYQQLQELLKKESRVHCCFLRKTKSVQNETDTQKITCTLDVASVPVRRPFLHIETQNKGILELLPAYKEPSPKDLYRDFCSFKILSVKNIDGFNAGLQDNVKLYKNRESSAEINNVADAIFYLQNQLGRPISLTVYDPFHGEPPYNFNDPKFKKNTSPFFLFTWDLPVEKAELSLPETYPSLGIEFCDEKVTVHEQPFQQLADSARVTFSTLSSLIAPDSDVHIKSLMGPPGILKTLHSFAKYDLRWCLWLVILINVNLAIFNLLPLPILDGGIIALALLQGIVRKKIATRLIATLQLICMFLILGLIVYVSFFDVNRILEESDLRQQAERKQLLALDEQIFWDHYQGHNL